LVLLVIAGDAALPFETAGERLVELTGEAAAEPRGDAGSAGAAGGAAGPGGARGPLPVRFMDSLSLLFYQPVAERAATLPQGAWRFSTVAHYASHAKFSSGPDFSLARDGEILRWELGAAWGIIDRMELQAVLPLHYATSGFLDAFIDDVHSVTRLGPTGLPRNQFADRLAFRGRTFHELEENRLGLGDASLAAKWSLLLEPEAPLGLALRGGLGLPSGSASRSFGSGQVDGGIGLLLEKALGSLHLYASASTSFPQAPRRFREAGVRIEPVVITASASVEWRIFEWLSALGQIDYGQPLLRNADIPQLTSARAMWSLGLKAGGPRFSVQAAVVEDLVSGAAADVIFLLGLEARL
jgi:hypothetical protein